MQSELKNDNCLGFFYIQPKPEEMDSAQPQRNDQTGMFVCQFCGRDDFPELTEVCCCYGGVYSARDSMLKGGQRKRLKSSYDRIRCGICFDVLSYSSKKLLKLIPDIY